MGRSKLCWGALSLVVGCGGPQLGRVGPAVSLPNGAPRTQCERADWYELAPARVQSTAMTAGFAFNTIHVRTHEGLGVFPSGGQAPKQLEDLWPRMTEPELQRRHEARIRPVDDAANRSLYWALGGLAGLIGGVGMAAATQEESPTAAAAFGVSGVVVGLVGVVGALATQPSGHDQLEAEARRRLFIPEEDDLVAAARGVNRVNGSQRERCGGRAVAFPSQKRPDTAKLVPSNAPQQTLPVPPTDVAGGAALPTSTSPATPSLPTTTPEDTPW